MQYLYGQDAEAASETVVDAFNLSEKKEDIRYHNGQAYYNFVGICVSHDKVLIVFPKHTYSVYDNKVDKLADAKLLFSVILKYLSKNYGTHNSDDYAGGLSVLDSTFPFYAVNRIFEYYDKFGLYKNREMIVSEKDGNNYLWNRIINDSQPFLTDGGVLYTPLYRKKFNDGYNFISKAMSFVMNYSIQLLPFIFTGRNCIKELQHYQNEFSNFMFVVKRLESILRSTFKNIDRQLIICLIDFFKSRNRTSKDEHIKIRYFDMIWQDMVEKYLNVYFRSINRKGLPEFNDTPLRSPNCKYFVEEKRESIDSSQNKWTIRMDHYHIDDNYQLIFDSKYYEDEAGLNYKQVTYHNEMMKRFRSEDDPTLNKIQTVSALFFPGNNGIREHYRTNKKYLVLNSNNIPIVKADEVVIWAVYLSVKRMMQIYVD